MAIFERTVAFRSSVSDVDPLYATMVFDDARAQMPLIALLGSFMGGDSLLSEAHHMAEVGLFALCPHLRGRGESTGARDSGGVEIMDIYDAIKATTAAFKDQIDTGNLNIWGRSGGGGNVYVSLARFPDLFRCAVALYGISDYGYDRQIGWYYNGASARHREQLEADIGVPSGAVDRYMARASLLAAGNNTQTTIHLFCDAEEETCPLPMHVEYVARATAHGCRNVQLHVSGPGSAIRWTHDRQHYSLADLEGFYLDDIQRGTCPPPELPENARLVVLGFLKTRRFSVWLGDGQNAVADLDYRLASDTKHFTFRLRTTDSHIRGRLAIPGPRPKVILVNEQETYWTYENGETMIEVNPNRSYTWLAALP